MPCIFLLVRIYIIPFPTQPPSRRYISGSILGFILGFCASPHARSSARHLLGIEYLFDVHGSPEAFCK
jgi:hypothetical protein